jgi:acetyl-CoA acetyltransferase
LLDHQRGRPRPVAVKYALSPRLVDYEIAAVDHHTEGLLMAPSDLIHRLLARHGLRFDDIDLWEIHEAFAAQVLANVAAIDEAIGSGLRLASTRISVPSRGMGSIPMAARSRSATPSPQQV